MSHIVSFREWKRTEERVEQKERKQKHRRRKQNDSVQADNKMISRNLSGIMRIIPNEC